MTCCSHRAAAGWFGSLIGFHCLDEVVYLCEEGVGIHAVDHAGLLNGLAAAGRAAQAMHTDSLEQGRGLRREVEHVADDGIFFNFDCHGCYLRRWIFFIISNVSTKINRSR